MTPVFKAEKEPKMTEAQAEKYTMRKECGAFSLGDRGKESIKIWLEKEGTIDDLDTESLDPAILFLFSLVERGLSYEHYHEMREKGFSHDKQGFYQYTLAKAASRKAGYQGEVKDGKEEGAHE